MTEVSSFYGIVVKIYFRDHGPPHFHAAYSGLEAVVGIASLNFEEGELPPTAKRLVRRWAELHQDELLAAWERAVRGEAPGKIAPLD